MKHLEEHRIHQVPSHAGDCEICGDRRTCYYVDHDFKGASVCQSCSGFVMIAERVLREADLTIPTDSIFFNRQSGLFDSLP